MKTVSKEDRDYLDKVALAVLQAMPRIDYHIPALAEACFDAAEDFLAERNKRYQLSEPDYYKIPDWVTAMNTKDIVNELSEINKVREANGLQPYGSPRRLFEIKGYSSEKEYLEATSTGGPVKVWLTQANNPHEEFSLAWQVWNYANIKYDPIPTLEGIKKTIGNIFYPGELDENFKEWFDLQVEKYGNEPAIYPEGDNDMMPYGESKIQ